ncbi:MAG: hypothetical protein H7831_03585 [Magnetococcus sp. WYHC-3]
MSGDAAGLGPLLLLGLKGMVWGALWWEAWHACRQAGVHPLAGSTTVAVLPAYGAFLLPGALGILAEPWISLTFLMLAALLLWGLVTLGQRSAAASSLPALASGHWHPLVVAVLVLLTAWSGDALSDLWGMWRHGFLNPETRLNYDTLHYHLPALVEFLQHRSLWSFENPYQHYHFGAEFVANLLSFPFHATWGIRLFHWMAIMLLVAAAWALSRPVAVVWGLGDRVSRVMVMAGVLGMWRLGTHSEWAQYGKNDAFQSGLILLALAVALEAWQRGTPSVGSRRRLLLAACALGLAWGVKPTTLPYLPFMVVGAALPGAVSTGWGFWHQRGFQRGVLLMTGVIVLLAGFWPLRNLLTFGSMGGPVSWASLWSTTVAANLLAPADLHNGRNLSLYLGLAAWFLGTLGLPWSLFRQGVWRVDRLFLWGIWTLAGVLLLVNPYGYLGSNFQVRFGMVFTALSGMALGVGVVHGVTAGSGWCLGLPRRCQVAVALGVGLGLMGFHEYWQRHPVAGLPGWANQRYRPTTRVYHWFDAQAPGQAVAVLDLLPYGFAGARWQNRLIYGMDPDRYLPGSEAVDLWRQLIRERAPDLIVVGREKFDGTPLASWFAASPCMERVFTDTDARVWRVNPTGGAFGGACEPPGTPSAPGASPLSQPQPFEKALRQQADDQHDPAPHP